MLILRGLIIALAGFGFIFLPGIILSLPPRRGLSFEPNILLWGMGVLLLGLFPAFFLTSLLRMVIFGGRFPEAAAGSAFSFVASLVAALFLEVGKYLVLRWRRIPAPRLVGSGIMLGIGAGLLTNVFQGISLVSAGFRLAIGDQSAPELAGVASQPWLELVLSLLGLNIYRLAVVSLSAALGGLVALAILRARQLWLWGAVLINAAAAWAYSAIGASLGNQTLPAILAVLLYQAALAGLALYWISRRAPSLQAQPAT
jgi:hypothetical protein